MAIDVQTRKKILKALDRGESADSIATRLEVGERSVKLTEQDETTLLEAVKQRPGITAAEALKKIKTKVAESTVCRFWKRSNLSRKKRR